MQVWLLDLPLRAVWPDGRGEDSCCRWRPCHYFSVEEQVALRRLSNEWRSVWFNKNYVGIFFAFPLCKSWLYLFTLVCLFLGIWKCLPHLSHPFNLLCHLLSPCTTHLSSFCASLLYLPVPCPILPCMESVFLGKCVVCCDKLVWMSCGVGLCVR